MADPQPPAEAPRGFDAIAGASARDGLLICELEGRVLWANAAVARQMGRTAEELTWSSLPQLFGPEDVGMLRSALGGLARGARMERPRLTAKLPDGRVNWLEVNGELVEHEGRQVVVLGFREQPVSVSALLHHLDQGVMTCDTLGRVTVWNQAARELHGLGSTEQPAYIEDLGCRFLTPDGHDLVADEHPLMEALRTGLDVSSTLVVVRPDGSERVVAVNSRPMTAGVTGSLGALVTLLDVTDRRRVERELRRRADTDPLTGLLNRGGILDHLSRRLSVDHPDRAVAVVFIDLDHFKWVNDRRGHAGGDLVLQQVAGVLSRRAAQGDAVARLGGDEFIVVTEARDLAHAGEIAEGLRSHLQGSGDTAGSGVMATLGVALSTGATDLAEALVEQAGHAAKLAKNRGRARVELFDDALRDEVARRRRVEDLVRSAIDDDRLVVEVQPVVSAADPHQVVGGEVLVRLVDKLGRLIGPEEFIDVAEASGLVTHIDRWLVGNACALARSTHDADPERSVVIGANLSATHLSNPDLALEVVAALQHHGAPGDRLCIEITERHVPNSIDVAAENLAALRQEGVWVVLDDFGSGCSSLGHLRRLPISGLKVESGLVQSEPGSRDEALLRAAVDMAHLLGCTVTAEGVRTVEQSLRAEAIGIDHCQGQLFAAPMAPEDFLELVGSGTGLPPTTDRSPSPAPAA